MTSKRGPRGGYALAMDPDDPIVLTYLGGGLAGEGRHTEAVARLQEALFIKPELYTAHVLMARSLAKLGDHEGSARHFQAALWASASLGRRRARGPPSHHRGTFR